MKKISRSILLVIFCFSFLLLTSCGQENKIFEHGVDITISSDLIDSFTIQENLPKLHFDMENVSCLVEANGACVYFVKNDQYKLSDAFSSHLEQYSKENIYIIKEQAQEYDSKEANFGKDKLPLDSTYPDGTTQKYAMEYQIVATQNDGTRYSYQYRTFVSNGKRYYIFRYTSNIGINLEQSIMVVKDKEGKNSLLLLALPFDTKYEVSGSAISKKALLERDTYLDERYYKFAYPSYLDGYESAAKIRMIKEWYITHCNGKTLENGDFVFNYLGANFKIEFGITDASSQMNTEGFKITYLA